jgi:hypothetical protein
MITQDLSEGNSPREVLVVFQPVPGECPKQGTDPRAIVGRIQESVWEIGIWMPYSEVSMSMMEGMKITEKGQRVDQAEEGITRVIFATRYLVSTEIPT